LKNMQTITRKGTHVLLEKVPFVVYGVYWISSTHCIVAGGGGHDIPNIIYIMKLGEDKFEKIQEKEFDKDEVVWVVSACPARNLICFTSQTKLYLVT